MVECHAGAKVLKRGEKSKTSHKLLREENGREPTSEFMYTDCLWILVLVLNHATLRGIS